MKNPWSNVYGVARSAIALGTLLTLLANDAVSLFSPAATGLIDTASTGQRFNFFALLASHLGLARFLACLVLLVVVSGYRPRFTGVLHWWIAWSFGTAVVPADGGDQVAAVLSLLMVPLTLTDPRRWHWDAPPPVDSASRVLASRIGLSTLAVARLQAVGIYFHAAVGKLLVPEWVNGTAMYYWALDPRVGVATRYRDLVLGALQPSFSVAFLTWTPIALELALCLMLTMSSNHPLRRPLFVLGLLFHFCNILLFGLVSFFCLMSGVLVLLARPAEQPFDFEPFKRRLRGWMPERVIHWRLALARRAGSLTEGGSSPSP